jgi:DMSO/TMAO reductase YedYZ heme-binding membrane subunit
MLALQSLSIARFRRLAPFFGSDATLLFHRQLGVMALVFAFAHPLVLFIVEPRTLEYLDPRVNALRAIFLVAAMIGLVLLTVLPLVREKIALKYEWWHVSHAVFAAGVLVVGLTHGLQVGHYISGVAKQAAWVAVAFAGLAPIAYVRLVRPLAAATNALPRRGRARGARRDHDARAEARGTRRAAPRRRAVCLAQARHVAVEPPAAPLLAVIQRARPRQARARDPGARGFHGQGARSPPGHARFAIASSMRARKCSALLGFRER